MIPDQKDTLILNMLIRTFKNDQEKIFSKWDSVVPLGKWTWPSTSQICDLTKIIFNFMTFDNN